jgi:hypothetical protein
MIDLIFSQYQIKAYVKEYSGNIVLKSYNRTTDKYIRYDMDVENIKVNVHGAAQETFVKYMWS